MYQAQHVYGRVFHTPIPSFQENLNMPARGTQAHYSAASNEHLPAHFAAKNGVQSAQPRHAKEAQTSKGLQQPDNANQWRAFRARKPKCQQHTGSMSTSTLPVKTQCELTRRLVQVYPRTLSQGGLAVSLRGTHGGNARQNGLAEHPLKSGNDYFETRFACLSPTSQQLVLTFV